MFTTLKQLGGRLLSLARKIDRSPKVTCRKPCRRVSLAVEGLEERAVPAPVSNPFNIFGHAAQPGYYGAPAFSSSRSITPNPGTSGLWGGPGPVLPGYVSNPISNRFMPLAQNPVNTLRGNLNFLSGIAPGVSRNANGFLGNFAQGVNMAFRSTGGNPFAYNYGQLQGTGLLDDGLLRSMLDGSGGFSYQPSANNVFSQNPVFQQNYGGPGGPSLVNFISRLL